MCDNLVDNNINIIGNTNTITHNYNVDNLAAADSGTSGHFLTSNNPCVNKITAINPLGIRMLDVNIIYSSHTYLIPQNTLPIKERKAHIFPDLKSKAILSIVMFCDNGCFALFDDKKVYIIDKITNKNIMHGTRNNKSTLYMVPLTPEQNEDMTECKIPERHFSGSLYKAKPKADLSNFLHVACWSPCKSALITAIKNNFISTWPGLTKQLYTTLFRS